MDAKHAKHTEPRKKNRRQAAIMLGIAAAVGVVLWWNGDPNRDDSPPPEPDQAEIAEQVFNETWEGMTLGDRNRMCVAYETLPAEQTVDSLMDKLDPKPEPDQREAVRQVFITRFNEECSVR